MENSNNKKLSSIAYPVSPKIDEDEIKEIANFEYEEWAPGVVVIKNAFKINE